MPSPLLSTFATLLLVVLCRRANSFLPIHHWALSTNRAEISLWSSSKWDNLVDEDDDEDEAFIPYDMRYEPRNCLKQSQNFVDIREAGGADLTNDVYVREPSNDVFWFVGKAARVSDVSIEACIARQWPLIELHASNLRPLELYPHRGKLQIWTAPGDTELEAAYNRPDLVFKKMSKDVEGAAGIHNMMVGFQGEIYDEGPGQAFRTWRTEDGRAAKPEVTSGPDQQVPSQEEIDKLLQNMDGKEINEVYKEQERRAGRTVDE